VRANENTERLFLVEILWIHYRGGPWFAERFETMCAQNGEFEICLEWVRSDSVSGMNGPCVSGMNDCRIA
jgi:hypothetical protein